MSPSKQKNEYYFFLGTEAELIKMTPVLKIFNRRGIKYKIISSGQNYIEESPMLEYLKRKVNIFFTKVPVYQKPTGLIYWFIVNLIKGIYILRRELRGKDLNKVWFVVHGDTVSTLMGSIIGRLTGLKVAHVEAGYKSPNLFRPFPEELDRTISSILSNVLFCPYDSIGRNPPQNKKCVNIGYNTSIDSLELALNRKTNSKLLLKIGKKKFFVFALHRQETLLNDELFRKLIKIVNSIDTNLICVFALHHPTKKKLEDTGLINFLKRNNKILLTNRLSYFEYIKVLDRSEFIMTDGVGNQQETYYLGKPCLILRNVTEGNEGLKGNALLSRINTKIIRDFPKIYNKYKRPKIADFKSPSKVIVDYLLSKNI